jgi:hypothetical protein
MLQSDHWSICQQHLGEQHFSRCCAPLAYHRSMSDGTKAERVEPHCVLNLLNHIELTLQKVEGSVGVIFSGHRPASLYSSII